MNERRPAPPETILSEPDAKQILARASELDVALRAGTSIATLRAAAAEAGISSAAFDAALAEAEAKEQERGTPARARQRPHLLSRAAAAAVMVLAIVTVSVQRSSTRARMIEPVLQVRCISPEDAAELIRPYLDRSSRILIPPGSHLLRVRATQAQIEKIRSVLAEAERSATTCASR